MIAKVKFSGFCVILTEEKYSSKMVCGNVGFSAYTKELLKKKKGYTTDVERNSSDGMSSISRKVMFPLLSPGEMITLMDDTNLEYEGETMGSLTVEYGWLPAVSYTHCKDWSYKKTSQYTNAYISIVWTFTNFENVKEDSTCINLNYAYQKKMESLIWGALETANAEFFQDVEEFAHDLSQLEIQF